LTVAVAHAPKPERIAIIGAGLMGHGLALVFADAGHIVAITDPVVEARQNVHERVVALLRSLGRDPRAAERITVADLLPEAVRDADIVIEAAPEKLALKQALFVELESHARPDALLCSNTSVLPIGEIARDVRSKHRVLGTHWWNPPYLVPLVEVIQGPATDPAHVARLIALLNGIGKVAVHVQKDVPGFVGNRMQHALWREAIALVDAGVCDAATVDLVVKNSFGRRLAVLGPLENADLVGTDLTLDIQNAVLAHLDRATEPTQTLQSLVRDGKLGFKTNAGFYTWSDEEKTALRAKVVSHLETLKRLLDD
jgi:3-hydroxybutyryl-CoA dehydrogenase